ncbi:hypothetical protein SDRG_06557 [Saprolegnia diclina VS20]|uniref:SAM-dependent MTase RsmB/NOP-type domain-containing protein n=1 Tax=Saprolegnia diclina (strain VS20) TaxID=1156394 RepID=T0RTH1_SAPDV|nr:hypothetical protein SDRG_06557 [Saprolegnia diclina VS20]EQC35798.1 hypothetical protein SDRG_06557 [Saprolegnia diclina VS20]|eukprot:XP_008610560.1 hypothetical protein SDRG_06557 [Saprolegnia diclina VS20]
MEPTQQQQAEPTEQPPSTAKADKLAEFKAVFREYLLHTQVVPEAEADAMMAILEAPLPVCFRLNYDGLESERLKSLFGETFQFDATKYSHNDVPIHPPRPIAWYPQEKTAWQVDCGRSAFSKSAHQFEEVRDFHATLLKHTEYGNIDRQEAVSMLPVLLLGVQPGHRILDMCASPGSKTTQIIDLLQNQAGMVVANDMNKKRAYMLVHRLSRNTLQSAVVTCTPGQDFPGLYDTNGVLQRTNVFDRVLCDVPCSGDGTLRKNQGLWKDWHIGQGLTLFPTQLALALRGASLLKVGGTMVYSTCSFNPIEDEAIVAELLRRADGALEVVDASGTLPGLAYRPGRNKWQVGWRSKSRATAKGHIINKVLVGDQEQLHQWFDTYEDVPFQLQADRILRAMFPPTSEDMLASLRRCMRLVPTDQDSGGFFIAVLRKVRELPGENQTGLAPLDEIENGKPPAGYTCKICGIQDDHYMKSCARYEIKEPSDEPVAKKPRVEHKIPKEAPYRRIPDDVWDTIQAYYEITDASLKNYLWCRADSGANLSYVEDGIAASCLAGDAIHIVNTGLKIFTKASIGKGTYYRPTTEGLAVLRPYMNARLLAFSARDLKLLIESEVAVQFTALEDVAAHPSTSDLANLPLGPAVAVLLPVAGMDDKVFKILRDKLLHNLWIGKGAFLPRLAKTVRDELKELMTTYLN